MFKYGSKRAPQVIRPTRLSPIQALTRGRNTMNNIALTARRPDAPTRGALTPDEWACHGRRLPGSGAPPIIASISRMMQENHQRNTKENS